MKDNLLSDIEKDIDGNWEDIQKRYIQYQKEKRVEEKKNSPNRPNISYERFHAALVDEYNNITGNGYVMEEIIDRFVFGSHEKMPNAFKRLWDMMCDPLLYEIIRVSCNGCREDYEIIYKREPIPYVYDIYGRYETTVEVFNVFCTGCGLRLARIKGTKKCLKSVLRLDKIKI